MFQLLPLRLGRTGSKPFESPAGGALAGRDHPLDGLRTGKIAGQRDARVDQQIGMAEGEVIMRRVDTFRPRMVRMNADPA